MSEKSDYWKIDEKLVRHVAKIARVNLTEQEIEKFTKQLGDILSTFKKIDELDIENVKPSFHPLEIKNVWREDKPKVWKWNPLSNTKLKEKKYFKGPKIV